jgi:hypothetical protein
LRKLLWFREGGETSERQWRDILGVMRAQRGNLDLSYLRDWARRLALTELYERATRESVGDTQ